MAAMGSCTVNFALITDIREAEKYGKLYHYY